MKAVLSDRYGSPDVLRIVDLPRPEPKANEVQIKVHATTVNRTDDGMLRPHPFFIRFASGLLRPKNTILGMDFAGEVESVGTEVTSFRQGDRVFGMSPDHFGAHAEFLCVPENGQIARMPSGVCFDEAVVCEGAWYANSCLKALGLRHGQKTLIYGASGAIGTAAVQLAKFYGAEVTAVVSTRHLDLATNIGADHVIDYTTEDFTKIGETFDGVFDAVGKTTFFKCRRLMKPNARYATTDLGPWWQNLFLPSWSSITGMNRVVLPFPKCIDGFVEFLKARIEAGEFSAVIDRRFPLEKIADAYRYVETGHKTGIVVIYVRHT